MKARSAIVGLVACVTATAAGYLAGTVSHPAPLVPPHVEQAPRSPGWPHVRAGYLRLHPVCEVCGARDGLEVHHVQPFHLVPALELDPGNLVALCRRHHFILGHLENWDSYNASVREDAAVWKARLASRP